MFYLELISMIILGCPIQEIVFDQVNMMEKTYIIFELDCSIIVSKLKISKKSSKTDFKVVKIDPSAA